MSFWHPVGTIVKPNLKVGSFDSQWFDKILKVKEHPSETDATIVCLDDNDTFADDMYNLSWLYADRWFELAIEPFEYETVDVVI